MQVSASLRAAITGLGSGALWVALASGVAVADVGVSVNVSLIGVEEGLHPGSSYELPAIIVSNPGSRQTAYEMAIGHVDGQQELWPTLGWFTFSPTDFSLGQGADRRVEVSLNVPTHAEPGAYAGLLKAQVVSGGDGAVAGAAAAARLTFEVVPRPPPSSTFSVGNVLPWVAAGALVAVLVSLARRFRFRVERRT